MGRRNTIRLEVAPPQEKTESNQIINHHHGEKAGDQNEELHGVSVNRDPSGAVTCPSDSFLPIKPGHSGLLHLTYQRDTRLFALVEIDVTERTKCENVTHVNYRRIHDMMGWGSQMGHM